MTKKAKPKNGKAKGGGNDVPGQINGNQLKSLLGDARRTSKSAAEISLAFAGKVANAVKNQHLNAKVFRQIATLDRMEPEKLAEFEAVRAYYMDVSGLTDRITAVGRLDLGDGHGEEEEAETETEARPEAGQKVVRPKFGNRKRNAAPASEAAE